MSVLPVKSLLEFIDDLGHVTSQPIEGCEQLFALGPENLIVVLESRDLPAELLLVSLECHLEWLESLKPF